MHELSIAGLVLDSVLRHAGGRRVTHVQLRVGHLRQVVPAALEFNWSLITRDTVAEGAALGIEQVATEGECRACGVRAPQPAFPMRCDACGGLTIDVVAGEELEIDWLEVAESEQAFSGRGA
jgi:hydrogenase nickel incorporation protein HypA/HybF